MGLSEKHNNLVDQSKTKPAKTGTEHAAKTL